MSAWGGAWQSAKYARWSAVPSRWVRVDQARQHRLPAQIDRGGVRSVSGRQLGARPEREDTVAAEREGFDDRVGCIQGPNLAVDQEGDAVVERAHWHDLRLCSPGFGRRSNPTSQAERDDAAFNQDDHRDESGRTGRSKEG